jgi:hypothetical protein
MGPTTTTFSPLSLYSHTLAVKKSGRLCPALIHKPEKNLGRIGHMYEVLNVGEKKN